jgi:hypothetical protein
VILLEDNIETTVAETFQNLIGSEIRHSVGVGVIGVFEGLRFELNCSKPLKQVVGDDAVTLSVEVSNEF